MTMFSVVVTALDAQGYLRECLESALNGAAADTEVEVVVVDNASTDASRAIIDEYAERDERVRAVRLPRRLPAGAARVAGAQQVGGDYVLFLEDTTPSCRMRSWRWPAAPKRPDGPT